MRKTYKYRIYLQNGQRRILNTMLEECRWVYNQTLEARKFAYEQSIKCGLYDTQAMLPGWKEKRPSLKLVHSQVLQNVQVRVDPALGAFFRRVKEGVEDAGYPRYVRHEVAYPIVAPKGRNLLFCQQFPTGTCVLSNQGV
jgi:putative transposase